VSPGPGPRRGPLAALVTLDRAVAAFERGLIVVLLAVMAGAVFLDALHRLFAAKEGRLEWLLVALTPAAMEGAVRRVVAPATLALVTFAIGYFALKARRPPGFRRARLLLEAALLAGGLALATRLLVWLLPNGLIWSQQMALCFMLWVALAGASLGAREQAHIAFELAGKLWPARLQRPVELLARVIAAGFALFLALLAAANALDHHEEWASSGGAAGNFEAFPVPRFLVFGFLPLPLAILGLRFLAYGVRPTQASAQAPAESPPR
jgi:TRAP-type C4-dicarboxylate transport system permease small subunit